MNLYEEFEKKTTATKITLIRKKPISSTTTARSQVSKPKKMGCGGSQQLCGKRKRRSAPAKLKTAPPVVVSSSSRRRGRRAVDAAAADESIVVPIAAAVNLDQSYASEPNHHSGARSADDDFADIYDSDGFYESTNGYQSNEEDLNENGDRADDRDQCLQSKSDLNGSLDLQ